MADPVHSFDTPLGRFSVRDGGGAIVEAGWRAMTGAEPTPLLIEAEAQVRAYWAGEREAFDLPVRVDAGPLVQDVCALLQAIPFGETRTYGDLARALGRPAQAVGQACGQNPIPLIVPCHRILSATGLGGFSAPGGVESKVILLRHEGAAGLLI
ncbi:methylated-DNA--[protein]-cysteine S-methyltransferase [Pseudooceanicola onchidii]|uniref:methylated-DNA--[protein]-cysteine S-methyltransferase n=1 Tax=Pseudooceanicola onchidii TaxID=2562279 RepID=UPI0010AAED51|nr:methylated-DNA--[protein]-cysteine S-methyltransferase [Pseudooceanicola onchidii]